MTGAGDDDVGADGAEGVVSTMRCTGKSAGWLQFGAEPSPSSVGLCSVGLCSVGLCSVGLRSVACRDAVVGIDGAASTDRCIGASTSITGAGKAASATSSTGVRCTVCDMGVWGAGVDVTGSLVASRWTGGSTGTLETDSVDTDPPDAGGAAASAFSLGVRCTVCDVAGGVSMVAVLVVSISVTGTSGDCCTDGCTGVRRTVGESGLTAGVVVSTPRCAGCDADVSAAGASISCCTGGSVGIAGDGVEAA